MEPNGGERRAPAVRGAHLGFAIGAAELLRDVNFEIEAGTFTGLIGPNGSGKTTLLKTIYRLYKPRQGAVYLDGADIHALPPKAAARKLAALPQEQGVAFDFPVMEMVLMARHAKRRFFESSTPADRAVCEEALKELGLYEFRDRNFLSLSGGEKQRVLLAAAFAQETPVIVLDEPANHLDIGQQLLIMEAIKRRQGAAVLASIHDLNLAAGYCDRLIALYRGRVAAQGAVEEVLTPALVGELFQVEAKIEREAETGRLHLRYLRGAEGGQGLRNR